MRSESTKPVGVHGASKTAWPNIAPAFVVMCCPTRLSRAAARLRGNLRAGKVSRKRASVAEGRCGT